MLRATLRSFLAHKGTGVFCYGLYPHDPYPGYPAVGRRPPGKGGCRGREIMAANRQR